MDQTYWWRRSCSGSSRTWALPSPLASLGWDLYVYGKGQPYQYKQEETMAWLAICLPLMALGVAVATVPLAYATHHQHTYGPHGSDPRRRETPRPAATSPGEMASHIVCPNCAALVVDQTMHDSSVHAIAIT